MTRLTDFLAYLVCLLFFLAAGILVRMHERRYLKALAARARNGEPPL